MILDAGVFYLAEQNPRRLAALLQELPESEFATNESVMAQVWRDPARQVLISRMLSGLDVEVEPLANGRGIGVLLGRTVTTDVVDASIALTSLSRQQPVLTTDPDDLKIFGSAVVAL